MSFEDSTSNVCKCQANYNDQAYADEDTVKKGVTYSKMYLSVYTKSLISRSPGISRLANGSPYSVPINDPK